MAMSIGVGYESSDDSDRRDGKRKATAIKEMCQHMPGMEHTVYRRSSMDGDKASTRSYSADGVLPRQRRCTVQDMNGNHKLQVVTPKQLEDISQRSAPGCMLLESTVSGKKARKSRARRKNTPKELDCNEQNGYRRSSMDCILPARPRSADAISRQRRSTVQDMGFDDSKSNFTPLNLVGLPQESDPKDTNMKVHRQRRRTTASMGRSRPARRRLSISLQEDYQGLAKYLSERSSNNNKKSHNRPRRRLSTSLQDDYQGLSKSADLGVDAREREENKLETSIDKRRPIETAKPTGASQKLKRAERTPSTTLTADTLEDSSKEESCISSCSKFPDDDDDDDAKEPLLHKVLCSCVCILLILAITVIGVYISFYSEYIRKLRSSARENDGHSHTTISILDPPTTPPSYAFSGSSAPSPMQSPLPSAQPSPSPTPNPLPGISLRGSIKPSAQPSASASASPTSKTYGFPSNYPSKMPSSTMRPSQDPSMQPSSQILLSDIPSLTSTTRPKCPEQLLKSLFLDGDNLLTMKYEVVMNDANSFSGLLCISLEYAGPSATIGLSFPQSGHTEAIVGSTSMINEEEEPEYTNNPGVYDIPEGILNLYTNQTTIVDGSVSSNDRMHTQMTFGKLLLEPNGAEIKPYEPMVLMYAVATDVNDFQWKYSYVTLLQESSSNRSGLRKRERQHDKYR